MNNKQISKECTGCKKTQSFENFHKDKHKVDGFHTRCKACCKNRNNNYIVKNNAFDIKNLANSKITKTCNSCKENKTLDNFTTNKTSKDGTSYKCKYCSSLYRKQMLNSPNHEKWLEKRRENNKNRYSTDINYRNKCRQDNKNTGEKFRKKWLYGITNCEYNSLIISQKNSCAICNMNFESLVNTYPNIDHCHKTNTIRGILCSDCNTMLGFAKDNTKTLEQSINYLLDIEETKNLNNLDFLDIKENKKNCALCGIYKELECFRKNKKTKDGYVLRCNDCSKKNFKYFLAKKYNIPYSSYLKIKEDQYNKCAICKTDFSTIPNERIHLDHCHVSNKIRGLLCHSCNLLLGRSRDSIKTLKNAISYLER